MQKTITHIHMTIIAIAITHIVTLKMDTKDTKISSRVVDIMVIAVTDIIPEMPVMVTAIPEPVREIILITILEEQI